MPIPFITRARPTISILAIYLTVIWHASDHAATYSRINDRDQFTYIWIRPGSYLTGCDPPDKECIGWERPRQKVVIENGFWIGQAEVIQAAYQRISTATSVCAASPTRSPSRLYFFLTVFTEVTFTVGTTIGRRIGTSPTPGCCCCCIRVSISVRT